jgi:hypothetical protein
MKFWYTSVFVNESRLTVLWNVQNSTTDLQVSWSNFGLGYIVVYMPGDVVVFVGDFVKLRKATISFMMSVYPFACPHAWEKSAVTKRIFIKFGIWLFFESLSR